MNIVQIIRHHQLFTFFMMAFIHSWIWWSGLFILAPNGPTGGLTAFSVPLPLYGLLGAQGSGVSGLVLSYVTEGRKGLRDIMYRIKL